MIEYKKIIIACTILTISLTPLFSCKKKKSEFKFPHIPAIYGNNLSKVIAFDADNILLLGAFGYAAKTTKGSQIRFENSKKHFWEVQDTGLSEALLTDASFPDSQHGWAVGITGIVIHTADGGKTWKRQESGTENHLFTVYFADTQNGWAAG
ncbi:MAG: hypothetical protein KAQ81_11740, partial [Deltaproteobacteria bacterium]|nr:hypothetical protein [Deltaproteobacteria bacterium]